MKIRILTENIKGLGLGHVVRSYNLAYEFSKIGYEVDLFIRGNADFKNFINKQEKINNIYVLSIQWEDIKNPNMLETDICIIDSYEINNFSIFLEHSRVLVIFDDDLRHLDFLTNTIKYNNNKNIFLLNINGLYDTQSIQKDISNNIFSGLEYVLLNDCFKDSNLCNLKYKYEFFVCLGGEDSKDKSMEISKQLQNFSKYIAVVVGPNYKGKLLDSNEFNKQNIAVFHNITQKEIALLMATSKYCIVSGGGIVFEALKLCKNVYTINLAFNQDKQLQVLESKNLITQIKLPLKQDMFNNIKDKKNYISDKIGVSIHDFISKIIMLSINQNINSIKQKGQKNFSIDNLYAINFCNMTNKEIQNILKYRNHPFIRNKMYSDNIIDEKTHYNFIESLKNNEYSKYFLVQENNCDIGVINLIRINIKHKQAYLGIYKNPFLDNDKHKSYGHLLMKMIKYIAFKHYNLNMLYLEVISINEIAIKFYEKEGFKLLGKLENGFRIYENGEEIFHDILIYGIKNIDK